MAHSKKKAQPAFDRPDAYREILSQKEEPKVKKSLVVEKPEKLGAKSKLNITTTILKDQSEERKAK